MKNITQWINAELGDGDIRIKVEDLEHDLYDGLILKTLVEKLTGEKIAMPAGEFVQSEARQMVNLENVLNRIEEILDIPKSQVKWSVKSIYEKNMLATLKLLLKLIHYFNTHEREEDDESLSYVTPVELPRSLKVDVIRIKQSDKKTKMQVESENLVANYTTKDGFDALIDQPPEKLIYVKKRLLQFANKHLGELTTKSTSCQLSSKLLNKVPQYFMLPLCYKVTGTTRKKRKKINYPKFLA